ncbi:methionine--tRNA ligase [Candidatus Woesearchaeota archaeon B3_Woes]|nr:MAG: methionine--tRNA ligase [Candidatus Woesearchaeota archaeon B3_Woes]
MTKFKRTIITSALPYVNNVPHLGTTVCVISADVFTRYLKSKGEDAIYVCGTDEHGTTAEVKALEEGLTPRQLVDKYFKIHKNIYEWFNCDFDCFGRTSSEDNKEVAVDIFKKLDKNNFIIENVLKQPFCKKCDKFLSDRYVEGTCPFCDYEEARGDQCENCGKLLNATELKKPKCKVCNQKPIIKDTNHLFIDLPRIEPELKKWISKIQDKWSDNARTMTNAWLKEGLKERCITRDLKWGIKVPKKGYENKVFYSWFDAPIGYIGITKETKKDWHDLWHSPDKTKLVQFMGKDNIPFHTILFPAFLIGAKDNYTLLNEINVNEYLNYETGKFSKSRGEGVFGDDAIETGICADAFRYYILINRPETSDTIFTWEDFQSKINNELVANIGNLVNRTIIFINKFFNGKVPKGKIDKKLVSKLEKEYSQIGKSLDNIKLKDGLKQIMNVSKVGNQFFQEKEPWKTKDQDALFTLANVVKDLAILIQPFLPKTSESIFKQLNIKPQKWKELGKTTIKQDHKLNKGELLFKKLEDKEVKEFKERFQGKNSELPLDLKIGKVLEIEDHPDADKLYVLQVDLGKEKRQLVAGLKPYYKKEELKGRNIVVVTNLEPAKLRGVESKGMLLAGGDDNNNVVLVNAENSSPGDEISSCKKQINFDEFLKIKIIVKNKKILANNQVLKEISCDIKDGSRVR